MDETGANGSTRCSVKEPIEQTRGCTDMSESASAQAVPHRDAKPRLVFDNYSYDTELDSTGEPGFSDEFGSRRADTVVFGSSWNI